MLDPAPLEYSSGGKGAGTVWGRLLAVVLAFFPLLLLLSVYGGWVVAWVAIGHRPGFIFDDPEDAGSAVRVAIVSAQVLLAAAWPLFIVHVALVGMMFYNHLTPGNPTRRKVAVLVAAVLPWAAAFLLFNVDPGDVLKWAGLTPP